MLSRALGHKVHHVSTQWSVSQGFALAILCPFLLVLCKPSAEKEHKQPWFIRGKEREVTTRWSRLALPTLPLCAAHCRHAASPPPGSHGQEHGDRRAPHSSSSASPGMCSAVTASSRASASSHPRGWPWWRVALADRKGQ